MTYSFHPAAAQELVEACQFYREQGGAALARGFIDEIERVASLLAANPAFGKPVGEGLRSFPIRRFPYSLIYRPVGDGVRILVVGHQHRRPGYWRRRR